MMGGTHTQLAHGFRHDPMDWVRTATNLEAALARRMLEVDPLDSDAATVERAIEDILAKQSPDGSFPQEDGRDQTLRYALELQVLGVPADHPAMARAAEILFTQLEKQLAGDDSELPYPGLIAALCPSSFGSHEVVARAVELYVTRRRDTWECPPASDSGWTCGATWARLSAALDRPGVREAVADSITKVSARTGAYGSDGQHTFSLVEGLGYVDLPEAQELAIKLVPIILRNQQDNGCWSDPVIQFVGSLGVGLDVLRCLHTHGLLEPLSELPPLPPDWEPTRTISIPDAKPALVLNDGGKLLVYCDDSKRLITVEPGEGRVVSEAQLADNAPTLDDEITGYCAYEGKVFLSVWQPRLWRVDTESGKTELLDLSDHLQRIAELRVRGGSIFLRDPFTGEKYRLEPDADTPTRLSPEEAEAWAEEHPVQPSWYWHVSYGMMRYDVARSFPPLDWAERPCEDAQSVTEVGDQICVPDREEGALCLFRRAARDGEAATGEAG